MECLFAMMMFPYLFHIVLLYTGVALPGFIAYLFGTSPAFIFRFFGGIILLFLLSAYVIGGIVAFLILGYLVYILAKPEKF